ncbi:MAG: succinate dehydrogenase assembly factor 2 [Mariprofundaceae bacterium]|nr:succinate dehydrogenase assembly factor 2 [Mariprofundaceae bacterium]
MSKIESDIRRLRHRLKCLGMAELDVWLSPLDEALLSKDTAMIAAVEQLLQYESPELLGMMKHQDKVPALLRQWLYPVAA